MKTIKKLNEMIKVVYDAEWGQYQVRVKDDRDATYYTDDKQDALDTAANMAKRHTPNPLRDAFTVSPEVMREKLEGVGLAFAIYEMEEKRTSRGEVAKIAECHVSSRNKAHREIQFISDLTGISSLKLQEAARKAYANMMCKLYPDSGFEPEDETKYFWN